jgi:hypothetical protein
MNWDAIGAIAELLGAIGVIASLVYLAGQIRFIEISAPSPPAGGCGPGLRVWMTRSA